MLRRLSRVHYYLQLAAAPYSAFPLHLHSNNSQVAAFLVHVECCSGCRPHLSLPLKFANYIHAERERERQRVNREFVHLESVAMSGGAATSALGWLDLGMFGAMLGLSALIGLYFGLTAKQDSAKEYLMGGKNMGMFPVSISLIARYLKIRNSTIKNFRIFF